MKLNFSTLLFFLIPQIILFSFPYVTGDLGFWTALGRDMIDHGRIITHDQYSVLETYPMVYPSWGISILYGLLDKIGGLELIFVFHRSVFLTFQYLIYKKIKPSDLDDKFFLSFILLVMVGAGIYCDRPAMIPMIYLVFSRSLLTSLKENTNLMKSACLLAVVILWANTHGSVFFNYILLFFLVVEDIAFGKKINPKPIIITLLIIFIATLINPFGFDIYPYAIETAKVSKFRHISEWNSPTLLTKDVFMEVSLFYCLGFLVLYKGVHKYGIKFFLSSSALVFIFGITTYRNIIWFFWIILLNLKMLHKPSQDNQTTIGLIFPEKVATVVMLVVIFILFPPLDRCFYDFTRNNNLITIEKYHESTPFYAVEEIVKSKNTGPVFNEFEFGGYLIYRLAHRNKIHMDGRNIIYKQDDFDMYLKALRGEEGYADLLNHYQFQFVLIKKRSFGLSQILRLDKSWRISYEDHRDILFERI